MNYIYTTANNGFMQRDSALSLIKVLQAANLPAKVVTSNYIPELDRRLADAQIDREHSLNMYDFFQNALSTPERAFSLQDLNLPYEPIQIFPNRNIDLFDDTKLVGRITPFEQTPVGKMRPQFLDLFASDGEINIRYVFDWRGFLSSKINYEPSKPHAKMKDQSFYTPLGEQTLFRELTDVGLPENFVLGKRKFVHEQDLFNYFTSLIQDEHVTSNIFTQYAPAAYAANAKLAPQAKNVYLYQESTSSEYIAKNQLNYVNNQHDHVINIDINQVPTFIDHEQLSTAMQDKTFILVVDWYKDVPGSVENMLVDALARLTQQFSIKIYLTGPYTDLMVYSADFTKKLRDAELDFVFAIENETLKFQDWFIKARLLISLHQNLNQKILQASLMARLPIVQVSNEQSGTNAIIPGQLHLLVHESSELLEHLSALLANLNLWNHYHVEMDKLAQQYQETKVTGIWTQLLSGD